MRKVILIFLFLIAVPRPVFAHTLKTDGSIGVLTHIDPDDEPVVGKEAKIFVTIEDSSGKFNSNNPSGCDCILYIEKDGQRLATLPVVSGGTYTQLRHIFGEFGRYELIVEGKPNGTGNPFQAFSTTFHYYVRGGGAREEQSGNVLLIYFPYLVVFVGSIIVIMFVDPFHRKAKEKNSFDNAGGKGKIRI